MNASSEDTKNANIISSSTTAAVTEVDGVIVPASDREITSSNLASNIRNHPTEDTGNDMTECQNDNGSSDEDEDDVSTILSESLFHSCISTATASSFFGDAPTDDNWKPGDNSSTGVDFTRNREKIEEPSRSRAREFLSEIQSEAVSRTGHSHGASISNDDETGEESVAPKSLWAKDDAEEHDTASRATIKERTTPSKSEAKTKGEDDAARPYNAATTEWESTAPSSTSNTVSHITVVNNSHGSNSNSNSTNTTNSSWNDISKTQPQLLHNLQRERPVVRSLTFNRDRTCLILSTSMGVRIRTLESLSLSLNGLGGQTDQENDCRQNQQQQQQHSVASEGRDQNVARTSGKTGTSHDNNIVNDVSAHSYLHDIPLPPDGSSYAQLLHDTSLIAVVRPSTPRCLYLYNAKGNTSYARNLNRSPLAAMPLSAAIKRVELTRNVLVALTVDGRLHVFHMGRSASDSSGANDGSPSSSTGPTVKAPVLKPTWIQTINILHSSDSLRNFSRGLEASYAGSYFDLSPNEKYPYLVCKSFNGTAGTIRVYDPTVVHEVDTSTGSGGNSLSGRSTSNRSLSSGGGISAASSWDFHYTHGNSVTSPSTGRKLKKRIQLHTTINAHEHPVTRMLIGGGGSVASTSTTTATQPQTYLATTSSNGTTIRVFALPTGQQLWEWHRGSRACQFHTLSWNGNADKLVSYGSSGTIHVFDWQHRDALSGRNSNINSADHSGEGEDGGEATIFRVADEGTASNRDTATLSETSNKKSNDASRPLIKRIGSKLRRQAAKNINSNNPTKHRSFAKLRIQTLLSTPSTIPPSNDANKNNDSNNKATTLVVALLDRRNPDISVDHGVTATSAEMDAVDTKEDSLVICNLEGELRQYSVNSAGSFRLTQMEDVLFRDANLFPVRGDRR